MSEIEKKEEIENQKDFEAMDVTSKWIYENQKISFENIGDSLLVTMDFIFIMRDFVHQGMPPSTAADTLLESICRKSEFLEKQTDGHREYIARMLTGAFYAIEALDKDEEESQICGLCGIIPPIISEDGGEDCTCDLEDDHIDPPENNRGPGDGVFLPEEVDSFMDIRVFHDLYSPNNFSIYYTKWQLVVILTTNSGSW